eukprot:TRINITY_DN22572_c0_g1_i1.p1 TRINITY_DN22572_c0_g1~~TRINITY_DN22572_c0_g1_i1.p1  ORF type:complete len:550 (+),score=168.64 TRINITY_DN22572_c0_g1_i1:79-1650(+)
MAAASAALALLAAGALVPRKDWVNVTVYRLTPINYTGVTNMDTGDATGDATFGLSQLLLPVLCPADPSFLWCQNRQYLSGGTAHMVYTEFVVETQPRFGDYAACNPNKDTGIFECQHFSPPSDDIPKQCQNDFRLQFEDCLNGTRYRTVSGGDEGACCAACHGDGDKCLAWNYANGSCDLMTAPLVTWPGQMHKGCAASAYHMKGYQRKCWYENPQYVGFADLCDKSKCSCDAIEQLAMGMEVGPMCWQHNKTQTLRIPPMPAFLARAQQPAALAAAPALGEAPYWKCAAAVFDSCYEAVMAGDSESCLKCAAAVPQCAAADAAAACSPQPSACYAAVKKQCGRPIAGDEIGACRICAFDAAAEGPMRAAHCNASLVNEACGVNGGGGGWGIGPWSDILTQFSCKMNGTWYSNQAAGRCNTTDPGEDCWWRVAETLSTKNQSCVDGRLVEVVRANDPGCMPGCPQPMNITTECVINCLFQVINGNATLGYPGLAPALLSKTFSGAFAPEKRGGCPEIYPPKSS